MKYHNKTKSEAIISEFNLLKPYINDPLLELIISKYLQHKPYTNRKRNINYI